MVKRTAREIKINENLLNNKNISVKVGTTENRNAPETIYIYFSFWIKPNKPTKKVNVDDTNYLRDKLVAKMSIICEHHLTKGILKDNKYFPGAIDNIYIYNIPDNFCYNDKSNFVSLEIYLNTINITSEDKLPLSHKKDKELFNEVVKVVNVVGKHMDFKENSIFSINNKANRKKNDYKQLNACVSA